MSALPPKADIAGRQFDVRFVPKADITRSRDRRAAARKVEQTAQAALTVFEMRVLGHGFVLDCTNDRREYCAASATGNHL
jgi:hypothetical protein